MTDLVPLSPPLHEQIAALAARHDRANGGVMRLLNRLGASAEGPMKMLPAPLEARLLSVTELALQQAYGLAEKTSRFGRLGPKSQGALSMVTGLAGGLGGMPSAIAELPVSITLILRALQEVALRHGYDPKEEAVAREILKVFAAGGPLEEDDGVNSAFIGARLTLTGPALQKMIATVAPKLAAALGQKLAAQAVPVMGAVTGAALNVAFLNYYREMAEVRFGLLRLAENHDPEVVTRDFLAAVTPQPRGKLVRRNQAR